MDKIKFLIKFPLDINGYHFKNWTDAGYQLGYKDGSAVRSRYERMKDTHSLKEIFVPKGTGSLFPLDVNGYHFTSWTDVAGQLGYSNGGVIKNRYERMKDTHSLEEIFVPRGTGSLFPLDVNGYHFVSWKMSSKQLGYKYGKSMMLRYEKMKDTHSLEEIFVPRIIQETFFPLEVNGYHFKNWTDAGYQLGYNGGSAVRSRYERMKDTHSLEEIFVPKGTGSLFPLDVNGYHFVSWRDAARQLGYSNGTSLQSFYYNMRNMRTLEEIFVPKVEKETIFPLDINGYHFTSWVDAAGQLGYLDGKNIHLRYQRMKDSHTLEEIFIPNNRKNDFFPLEVNGCYFLNWADAARRLGYLAPKSIKKRYTSMKDTHTLEEIFVPKVGTESIFPLDINGYHFTSWVDAGGQLKCREDLLRRRYREEYTLMETFGFSLHISDNGPTKINDFLYIQSKISDNLYKCKNKKTGLFELHTYEELNGMWRKYKGVKIVKEE